MKFYSYFKLLLGLIFILGGLAYLYKPGIIYRINRVLRETILNDSYVALSKTRIGIILFLMGTILLYISLAGLFSF